MMVHGRHQKNALSFRRFIIYDLRNDGYNRKHKHYSYDGRIESVARKHRDAGGEPAQSQRARIAHEYRSGKYVEQKKTAKRSGKDETDQRKRIFRARLSRSRVLQRNQHAEREKIRRGRSARQSVQSVG